MDAIRKQPFSVVLLDEFEKASLVIWNLFLQVFDAGRLTDRRGNTADFRHAVIIMTSNLGATVARDAGVGFAAADPRFSPAAVERALGGVFPPEFLNRIDRVVVFRPLDRPTMREILRKELDGVLTRRGLRNRTWAVEWDESAIEFLLEQGFTPALGARPLRRAVERWVLAPLALAIVNRQVPEGDQFLFVRSDGDRVEVEFVDPDAPARGPAVEADRSPTPADLRLEDLILDARGAPGELQLLRAEARRIGERVAAPELRRRKEQALAEMSASAFWTAPSRFETLGMAEYLDRLEQARASVASLLRRLDGTGGRPRPHYPADVVRRLAQLLYLMDAACDGLAKGRPRDAFLAVTAIRDAGVPPETSDGFAARLDAMYRAWARRRRMRLEIVEEPSPDGAPYRSVQAVSGFAAFVILEPEAGMHVLEVPEPDGAFARARARVAVAPQPDEPANRIPGGLRAQAATALAAAGAGAPVVVRRYRETPSPLVRDTVRQWRTGRLDRVLAGDFDLIVPRAGQTTGEDGPIGGP